jgi:hypothetical protein
MHNLQRFASLFDIVVLIFDDRSQIDVTLAPMVGDVRNLGEILIYHKNYYTVVFRAKLTSRR